MQIKAIMKFNEMLFLLSDLNKCKWSEKLNVDEATWKKELTGSVNGKQISRATLTCNLAGSGITSRVYHTWPIISYICLCTHIHVYICVLHIHIFTHMYVHIHTHVHTHYRNIHIAQ